MKFIDEVVVRVQAGRGGDGCLSFHRGPYKPKGGPDGGNGGRGGDITLYGSTDINTLVDFRYRPLVRAGNGKAGSSQNQTGAAGEDMQLVVPCGTTVIDDETLLTLGDIVTDGQTMRIAKGGKQGVGNAAFKSSTRQTPRKILKGADGETRLLRLQLKILADVGLLGLPNAGKSTLISRVSNSRPKIADYPFTTLEPNLGVVDWDPGKSFVIADIPGIIPDASQGKGLGFRFLRHLSRSVSLLHLVDLSDPTDLTSRVKSIENELYTFSASFRKKDIWLVGTKADALDEATTQTLVSQLEADFPERKVLAISSISGAGLDDLIYRLGNHTEVQMHRNIQDVEQEQLTHDILQHEVSGSKSAPDSEDTSEEAEVIYVNQ